jgi:protease IV
MNYKLISSILACPWFIQRQWADANLPLVVALLQGKQVSFVQRSGNETAEMPFVIDPATMQRFDFYKYDYATGKLVANPNLPPNSIGILPLTGPMTYYNGDCGEPGMMQRNNWLMDMNSRDNIAAVVQLIDTPGGEARAANAYCTTLAKMNKPVLSFVDNICASLGMWFSSGSDETYLSHDLASMGSIGSYIMLADWSGYLEKQGIKLHEIYASQSLDKNKGYKDALNGDYTEVQASLTKHVDAFINYVSDQRGEKAAANMGEWNSGKMFDGKDAVSIGLADGIRPLDQVISKAAWLAKRKN